MGTLGYMFKLNQFDIAGPTTPTQMIMSFLKPTRLRVKAIFKQLSL